MLLFVKQRYVEQIRAGVKRWEIRAGARYRNVQAGSTLSLNGRDRVTVREVERLSARQCEQRGLIASSAELHEMYPEADSFFVFHFA